MKVLVDDRWYGATGIGRYAAEVVARAPTDVEIWRLGTSWRIRSPISPLRLGRAARIRHPDLFWSPGFMPPAWPGVPFAITIHDLIHRKFGTQLQREYYDWVIRPLARKAGVVLTVSEYTRTEILEWARLPEERVVAVPHGVANTFTPDGEKYELAEPYLLYVGNRRTHKNIPRLLQAFGNSRISRAVLLVLSGEVDRSVESLIERNGLAGRVVFLGAISEEALPSVYRGALGLVYVSLYEGFGLPSIEAMACGTPVITSATTAMPEVVGDAALLVDPEDIEQIADAMTTLVQEESTRGKLVARGLKRIATFSWATSAERTWTALRAATC